METKNKIMQATYGLFAEKGMEFSLSEVADIVGIKKASIYSHFQSKEELLYQLFNKEIDEYFVIVECRSKTLKELFFGILNYFTSSREKLLFWKRLLLFPPDTMESEIRERILDLSDRRFKKVMILIQSSSTAKVPQERKAELLTLMFLSIIHGLLSSEIIYENHNVERFFEEEWLLLEKFFRKEE